MESGVMDNKSDKDRQGEEQALRKQYPGYRGADEAYCHAGRAALERFLDMKFGLRIHWGLYSITGCGPESWSLTAPKGGTPAYREQYETLAGWWNPTRFDANHWCRMMTSAGLKFFTFTTKHHDGFSLYDTKTRIVRRVVHEGLDAGTIVPCDLHYSIMEGPCGRDLTAELTEAGRRHGLGIGLYFSHIDWFDADFRIDQWNYQVTDDLYARNLPYTRATDAEGFGRMIARHREQLRELATRYGPLDLLSLDMWFPENSGIEPDLAETVKMLRRLQPEMLIRNRGIGPYGDYTTPERDVPIDPESGKDERGRPVDIPWKVIFPGSRHFSHIWQDRYHPVKWIVHKLVDISAKGGVFQIGYGPLPDGAWPPQVERLLEETGRWLAVNGEGIYGTRRHAPWREGETVRYTRTKDGRTVYAFLLEWPCTPLRGGLLRLEGIRAASDAEVKMLGTDHALRYRQDEKALTIELPEGLADPDRRPCRHAWTFRIPVEDA